MNPLFAAGIEFQEFVQRQGWRCCIIGGLAVIRWGQPRATQDVDFSLLTEFGQENARINELLEHFDVRLPDARQFAIESRVVLIKASNGTPLDVALAGFPYEERIIDRASSFDFTSSTTLWTASAEDLVVLKAFSGRSQDWADVEGILTRQSSELVWDIVWLELQALCELLGDDTPVRRLETLQRDS